MSFFLCRMEFHGVGGGGVREIHSRWKSSVDYPAFWLFQECGGGGGLRKVVCVLCGERV